MITKRYYAYYRKDGKNISYEVTDQNDIDELVSERRKIGKRMSYVDKLMKEQWTREHRAGYCECCHVLKPLTGICDICGN